MTRKLAVMLPARPRQVVPFLKTQIPYLPGDAAYEDPEIFHEFIGSQVQRNADIGRQLVSKLNYAPGELVAFLETCSGPGAMIKDLHLDFPKCTSVAVDRSAQMCKLGRRLNPHLTFVRADVLGPELPDTLAKSVRRPQRGPLRFDVALNSPSSLGFFSATELEDHLVVMSRLLKVKTGAYFADIGNYSSVAAASLNNHKKLPGKFRGEKSSDWIVTTKYYPLSDFHEISWSAWSRATNRLLFALTHKMRALRPSELARIAHRIGLGFRVWRIELDAAKRYVFTAVDDESHYSFIKGVDFMVEFHRPLAPRLDDRRV